MADTSLRPPHGLDLLANLAPPSSSRTWQSVPHPTLPILATACADRSVRIYSLTSFTLLHSITGGHKRSIRSVSWKPATPGQSVLATGSFDASAGIWRREHHDDNAGDGDERSRDGDGNTEHDADDYQFSCILDGHESEIKCVSWSPTGQFLATCSRDKSVWIWEELEDDNFETVAVLQEHDGDVKCVAWHPHELLLASASYDDTVRLYREDADDWVQVALLTGHAQTVWCIQFEASTAAKHDFRARLPPPRPYASDSQRQSHTQELERSGPRLATCSDDCTVRIWRRVSPSQQDGDSSSSSSSAKTGIPSIIRAAALDEDWIQDAVLPRRHDRAVYSLAWSPTTGLLASAGSDGRIVVYREEWTDRAVHDENNSPAQTLDDEPTRLTQWVVVAEIDAAHDVFEINHVAWARRADAGARWEGEEVVVSTGDDGEVRVWTVTFEGVGSAC